MVVDFMGVMRKCAHCKSADGTVEWSDDYDMYACDNCLQNFTEDAYERYCADFHDGGSTKFNSLLDDQILARRMK